MAIGIGGRFARLAISTIGFQIIVEFTLLHGTSPCTFGEVLKMLCDYLGSGIIGRQHPAAAGLFLLCQQWTFPFDPIEEHR